MEDAQKLFDEMPERTLISWTILMSGYAKHGLAYEALVVFRDMLSDNKDRRRLCPDPFVYSVVLRACAAMEDLNFGRGVHGHVLKRNGFVDDFVENALVNMYASCGSLAGAVVVFDRIGSPDLVAWSSLLNGYVRNGYEEEGLRIFLDMISHGVEPDAFAFSMAIGACGSLGCLDLGGQLHCSVIKMGLGSCLFLENSLMDFYAKCGNLEGLRQVFDQMVVKDLVSWNTVIFYIFFSRALRDQQQVLWVSDDGVLDLGGISEDVCFADEVCQPTLKYPGAYRKISVELKIHHLAVDALLKSNQLNEMEGGSLLGFDQDASSGAHDFNEHSSFDETTSCAPALRVLKQLIQRCLTDAVTSGNVYADAILQHLYRWLCSPTSKLHDPALHCILHKVMQKVFAFLLAELRKLGATIILASFSEIIIDTGKVELSAARAYCDSILKTLQTRELFEWIELEPLQFWHSLLFMDQYNYGGIPAKDEAVIHDESQVDIVSSWNIAEYLPKKVQDHFVFIVSQFMYIPWNYAQKQAAIRANLQDSSSSTPSITVAAGEALESHMTEYLKGQISSYFTDKLLGIVRDTLLHMKGANRSENEQHTSLAPPQLSGSIHTGDAALEFVKHICAVLALDQNVQHDVLVMRKNLLKYVRVREFAPEAEFRDPCPSFIIPNVFCSYCNDCRVLDLCRDSSLLAQEWRCAVPQCAQPYDREVMENALLQIVRQREQLYHLQDLVCLRCNQIKAAHLTEQCACAGSFRCKEDVTEFQSKMQVFLNIATHQKFQLLQECTSWVLEVK